MNEICDICGAIKSKHNLISNYTDGEHLICQQLSRTDKIMEFYPSGLVAIPKEFVEAVEELVGPYRIHKNATIFDKIDLLDEKMKKVSGLLAQMKKEG